MNTRSCSAIAVFVSLMFVVSLLHLGCKKDDSTSTAPPGPTVSYGSGTITATSSAGSLSITGTGVYPFQAGPSVIAVLDTSHGPILVMYGYERVSGPNYNVVALAALAPAGVVAGAYNHPQITFGAAYNTDTTRQADSLVYQCVSGNMVISGVTGSNAWGQYSVMARKGSGQAIQFSGTFNVIYVVGVLPENPGRSLQRRSLLPSPF